MSYLLDFYGEAIPEKHKEIMSQYYEEDLSLAEIAQNYDISRQGARHLIKKGEEQLLFLEEKLGLAKRYKDATLGYSEFARLMELLKEEILKTDNNERLLDLYQQVCCLSEKMKLE